MHGFKPTAQRAKKRNFADGGMVPLEDQQAQQLAAPAAPTTLPPEALGSGAAANAGKALQGRQAQLDAALNYADGGMIRGPGTGTSDDIETEVPEGSFIMPADSTKRIGAGVLDGMGKPTKVNLSNGEYELPPEQVHAVGAQVLDQIKGDTHVPAEKQAGKGFKPEMFFADGGLVDEEKRKRQALPAYDPNPNIRNAQAAADTTAQTNAVAGATPGYSTNAIVRQGQVNNDQGAQQRAVAAASPPVAPVATPEPAGGRGFGSTLKDYYSGALKTAGGALAAPYGVIADGARVTATNLAGGDPASLSGGPTKYTDMSAGLMSSGVDDLSRAGQNTQAGARDVLGVQPAKPVPAAPAAVTPAPAAAPVATQPSSTALLPGAASAPTDINAQAAAAAPTLAAMAAEKAGTAGGENNITRVGNSFSGGKVGAGFTVNGQPFTPSGVEQSPQNRAAVDALLARTPDFGAGAGAGGAAGRGFAAPGITVIGTGSGADDPARRNLIRDASTPLAGAQNGQLTANQLNTRRSLLESEGRNDTALQTNAQTNQQQLASAAMREDGANQRAAFQEGGQNSRFAASNSLDQQKLASENEGRGFQNRAAQRVEKLYERYDNAKTQEDKAAISQQIRDLNGKDTPQRYTVVPGGQAFRPDGTAYTLPSVVLNNQTGEFKQQPANNAAQSGASTIPTPKNPAEYAALPKGAQYMKDGQLRVKQ